MQLGQEDQGPLKREQEALLVLGHGGGSGAGRLVDNPLASQTRVDTGDTNVRLNPPACYLAPFRPASSFAGTPGLAPVAALTWRFPEESKQERDAQEKDKQNGWNQGKE